MYSGIIVSFRFSPSGEPPQNGVCMPLRCGYLPVMMAAAGHHVQYQQSCGAVDKQGSLDLLLVGEQTFCTLCRTQFKANSDTVR